MSRSHLMTTARAALFAVAALGATTLATSAPAEAKHWRDFGVSINIGDGYNSVHVGRSCRYYYRKWQNTGDSYWWDRYESCRDGY